jgi:hypothetical protein
MRIFWDIYYERACERAEFSVFYHDERLLFHENTCDSMCNLAAF